MGLFSPAKAAAAVSATAYVSVAIETLLPTRDLPFDLFLRPPRQASYALYRQRQLPWQTQDISRLQEAGIRTLYIDFAAQHLYCEYLRQALLEDSQLDNQQRYQVLRASTHSLLREAFSDSDVTAVVRSLAPVADVIVHCICAEEIVLREVFSLMAHDYCTFTHANNVATLCVAMAIRLGIGNESDLASMACGALLHDLGKRHLPAVILNKKAPLTAEERGIVRQHPQLGFAELCQVPSVSWPQLMMVYQHHERINGTGYPAQIPGEELHPWARICSVADAFNAMTSQRPYRPAMTADQALALCQQHAGKIYDQEVVQCLTSLMSNS